MILDYITFENKTPVPKSPECKTQDEVDHFEFCPPSTVSTDWLIEQWAITISRLSEERLRNLIQEVSGILRNKEDHIKVLTRT